MSDLGTWVDRSTSAIGKGLVAGVVGTAAMSASAAVEMKLRGREASHTPAEAICALLGVAGLRGRRAADAFFALAWAGEMTALPAIDLASPVTEWGADALLTGGAHHLVYAVATSAAYDALDAA